MSLLPGSVNHIYQNAEADIDGTPLVIFRDHRWTLPVIAAAEEKDFLSVPATVVTFDRHRDLLEPRRGIGPLRQWKTRGGSFTEIIELVENHCSPRDDDWILSGMELGLIGDVIQFNACETYEEEPASVVSHADSGGVKHKVFQLGRPARELSFKGSLVQKSSEGITDAIARLIGWDPSLPGISSASNGFLLDIDLDFFTIGWLNYTLPFSDEIFDGEFFKSCQSEYYEDYSPVSFFCDLVTHASVITIATEPDFCGGNEKAKAVMRSVDRLLFNGMLDSKNIRTGYSPQYPHE